MVIGINLNHDYAFCTVHKNEIFLNEIERTSRIRHHATKDVHNLTLLDNFSIKELVQVKAIYLNSPMMRKIMLQGGDLSSTKRSYKYIGKYVAKNNSLGLAYGKLLIEDIEIPAAWVSHYHAHAASSFWASPFEKADIFCLDGGGDYGEGASFHGNKSDIVLENRFSDAQFGSSYHYFSHRVYGVTQGFYESKVMAIASFGNKIFSHNNFMNRNGGLNDIDTNKIISVDDIAEFQYQFENGVLNLIANNKSNNKNLCCAGGCFLNVNLNTVVANSKMYNEIYIPPYTGDMGTAIGCALYAHKDVYNKLLPKSILNTGFLGYDIDIEINLLKI